MIKSLLHEMATMEEISTVNFINYSFTIQVLKKVYRIPDPTNLFKESMFEKVKKAIAFKVSTIQ